jgi:hypothetical protein
MRKYFIISSILLVGMLFSSCQNTTLKLENASVTYNKSRITENGLEARSMSLSGNQMLSGESCATWQIPGLDNAELKLDNIFAVYSDDEGFTSDHICLNIDFLYAQDGSSIRYQFWIYPNAPGIRTQLFLKKDKEEANHEIAEGISLQLATNPDLNTIQAFGYYNDTQHRNYRETPILRTSETELSPELAIDWANGIILSDQEKSLLLVKESHKCVNQTGVNTGDFSFQQNTLRISGLGLDTANLNGEYQACWANWIILSDSQNEEQLNLKQFDRLRYPIDPKRDIYIMSNTWGSGDDYANSKYASREENILKEIESAHDLGIDLLQIDDGWQGWGYDSWRPSKTNTYKRRSAKFHAAIPDGTEYPNYPDGWNNIKKAADEVNLRMGLWGAWQIPYEDLVWNYENGGFTSYKLDFARLNNYDKLSSFITKIREFALYIDHQVRVNWDVTENSPRIGYFFGREYGNIYLENRKPMQPAHVVYKPWLVLRDAWHVAKYTNLNKFQVTYQNIDLVNKELSDAWMHKHDYCLAITLMGSPIFFQETQHLNEAARAKLKPLINAYKQVRDEMYAGYVFPIGQEPSNDHWTGFQNTQSGSQSGFLTIFRERLCEENRRSFQLHFVKDCTIQLTNLITGESFTTQVDQEGKTSFEISEAGDYRFYSYQKIQ